MCSKVVLATVCSEWYGRLCWLGELTNVGSSWRCRLTPGTDRNLNKYYNNNLQGTD